MSNHTPPLWALPAFLVVGLFMRLPASVRWGSAALALVGLGWWFG